MIGATLASVLLLAGQGGQAQEKTKLTNPKPATVNVNGYVTQAEARQVFARAEKVLRSASKSRASVPPIKISSSAKPATRAELVLEFARLYDVAKPKFKLIPTPLVPNTSVIKMSHPAARERLLLLVKRGAVANHGPLAAGPEDKLTLRQFGDAIGFFLARMAEMTHLPNRFSPSIMPSGGNE